MTRDMTCTFRTIIGSGTARYRWNIPTWFRDEDGAADQDHRSLVDINERVIEMQIVIAFMYVDRDRGFHQHSHKSAGVMV
jgi:hypothetical protein